MILEQCKGVHCVDLGESFQNAYFLAKFGFDTAENEPSKVCRIHSGEVRLRRVGARPPHVRARGGRPRAPRGARGRDGLRASLRGRAARGARGRELGRHLVLHRGRERLPLRPAAHDRGSAPPEGTENEIILVLVRKIEKSEDFLQIFGMRIMEEISEKICEIPTKFGDVSARIGTNVKQI